jgi:hypothetical protein
MDIELYFQELISGSTWPCQAACPIHTEGWPGAEGGNDVD